MHEVASPQAFEGLRLSRRKVRNPHSSLATIDHCVAAKKQIETMTENRNVNP